MAKRKSKAKGKADRGLEVEEAPMDEAPAGAEAGLESGLVVLTFIVLIVSLVLSQMELGSAFNKGMLG